MERQTAPTTFERASRTDVKVAVKNALRSAGVRSVKELEHQARTGRFSSERARIAWMSIAPVVTNGS